MIQSLLVKAIKKINQWWLYIRGKCEICGGEIVWDTYHNQCEVCGKIYR